PVARRERVRRGGRRAAPVAARGERDLAGDGAERARPGDDEPLLRDGLRGPARERDRARAAGGLRGPGGPVHLLAHRAGVDAGAEPDVGAAALWAGAGAGRDLLP